MTASSASPGLEYSFTVRKSSVIKGFPVFSSSFDVPPVFGISRKAFTALCGSSLPVNSLTRKKNESPITPTRHIRTVNLAAICFLRRILFLRSRSCRALTCAARERLDAGRSYGSGSAALTGLERLAAEFLCGAGAGRRPDICPLCGAGRTPETGPPPGAVTGRLPDGIFGGDTDIRRRAGGTSRCPACVPAPVPEPVFTVTSDHILMFSPDAFLALTRSCLSSLSPDKSITFSSISLHPLYPPI